MYPKQLSKPMMGQVVLTLACEKSILNEMADEGMLSPK